MWERLAFPAARTYQRARSCVLPAVPSRRARVRGLISFAGMYVGCAFRPRDKGGKIVAVLPLCPLAKECLRSHKSSCLHKPKKGRPQHQPSRTPNHASSPPSRRRRRLRPRLLCFLRLVPPAPSLSVGLHAFLFGILVAVACFRFSTAARPVDVLSMGLELLQPAQAQEPEIGVRGLLRRDLLRRERGPGPGADASAENGRANRPRAVSGGKLKLAVFFYCWLLLPLLLLLVCADTDHEG